MHNSCQNFKAIPFVLFCQAQELSMNFKISKILLGGEQLCKFIKRRKNPVELERRGCSRKWVKEEQQGPFMDVYFGEVSTPQRCLSIKETVDKVDGIWRNPPRNFFGRTFILYPHLPNIKLRHQRGLGPVPMKANEGYNFNVWLLLPSYNLFLLLFWFNITGLTAVISIILLNPVT